MSNKYQAKIEEYEAAGLYDLDVMPYDVENLLPIDASYSYACEGILERVLRPVLIVITKVVLFPLLKIGLGMKCVGREKLRKTDGGIVVTNHVHYLDSVMIHWCFGSERTYHTGAAFNAKANISLPFFKALGFLPLNGSFQAQKNLMNFLQRKLERGNYVQFYPEHAFWLRYEKIRPFRPGAFKYAAKFRQPVIPTLIVWEETPLRKFFHLKKRAVLMVLDPVQPDYSLLERDCAEKMQRETEAAIRSAHDAFYAAQNKK